MKNYLIATVAFTLCAAVGHSDGSRPEITVRNSAEVVVVDQNIQEWIKTCRGHLAQRAKENKKVLEAFDLFSNQLDTAYREERSLTAGDVEKILNGVTFAAEKHQLQTRKNEEQTPYISHPIGVATHLMNIGSVRDSSIIIAALLHDTVEDTQTTFAEIEAKFGKDVSNYVKEVTDDKSLSKNERKRRQVISAAHKSAGAAQIKLADKFYNLNDLLHNTPAEWNQARVDQYYQWAKSVVDRLPASNEALKEAVEHTIQQYWETQGKAS